jgi:hypothetical protein
MGKIRLYTGSIKEYGRELINFEEITGVQLHLCRRFHGDDDFTTIVPLIQIFCMLHEHPHLFSE